ncbi:DUF4192 family protein [Paramicrobacterium chengjingii]|uniref:DUF4192 family protein n=1 Tax=Paramicrobacterium chengjingii TaxID=2769067 RepID=A0ABX6YHK1_9MICO|nr:DUF4192 family protein [Microbacterium chengjingii]QPZ37860.1 DUF4192 family protein [Microbacterium chengjingii]
MTMPHKNSEFLYESYVHLPYVDEWEREAITDELLDICEPLSETRESAGAGMLSFNEPHINALFDVVPLVESLLKVEPNHVPLFHAAELVMVCNFPSLAEAVALQIAFGREIGVENRRRWLSLITEAKIHEMSVDDYVLELTNRSDFACDRVSRLFRGDEKQSPVGERLRLGIALLRRVIALVPTPYRAGLLCALAWLQWANGKRAISLVYLEEAARLEPDHTLVFGLTVHFSSRKPAWIPVR